MSVLYTPIQLYKGTLTAVLTTNLYIAPSKVIIKEIILCNTSAGVVPVTLKYGVSGSEIAIFDAKNLQAGETKIISTSTILESNEVIDGGDDTGSVVDIFISGIVIT